MRLFSSTTAASRALALGTLAALALGCAGRAAAAEGRLTAKAFEGVWRITKVVRTGPNAGVDSHPQPGLEIFYRGYFSIIRDSSSAPRMPAPAPADPTRLTDAEKVARYDEWVPFGASAGTYEVKGETIVTHNLVAKQVRGVGMTEEATFKFDGPDTFVATAKSEPGVPAGRQTTYTRMR